MAMKEDVSVDDMSHKVKEILSVSSEPDEVIVRFKDVTGIKRTKSYTPKEALRCADTAYNVAFVASAQMMTKRSEEFLELAHDLIQHADEALGKAGKVKFSDRYIDIQDMIKQFEIEKKSKLRSHNEKSK